MSMGAQRHLPFAACPGLTGNWFDLATNTRRLRFIEYHETSRRQAEPSTAPCNRDDHRQGASLRARSPRTPAKPAAHTAWRALPDWN